MGGPQRTNRPPARIVHCKPSTHLHRPSPPRYSGRGDIYSLELPFGIPEIPVAMTLHEIHALLFQLPCKCCFIVSVDHTSKKRVRARRFSASSAFFEWSFALDVGSDRLAFLNGGGVVSSLASIRLLSLKCMNLSGRGPGQRNPLLSLPSHLDWL